MAYSKRSSIFVTIVTIATIGYNSYNSEKDMVTRQAIRYFGSKMRLAEWIIGNFPPHECYVEPFCGSASVFLRKPPSKIEVINDLDGEVINFFKMLREHTDDLINAINLTPYSRTEYVLAWKHADDPLERARRYYVRAWQGFSGNTNAPTGWRYQRDSSRNKSIIDDWCESADRLPPIVERLKHAFIENDDAINVIHRYDAPGTLFYIDPPYLHETRSRNGKNNGANYRCEVDDSYHQSLLQAILGAIGMVAISGYDSEMYNDTLADWHKCMKVARTQNTSVTKVEHLWLSPNVDRAAMRLF